MNCRILALLIALLAGAVACPSRTFAHRAGGTTEPVNAPADFPAAWTGNWRGPCRVVQLGGKGNVIEFTMELSVASTDAPNRFKWQIVYIDGDQRQVREYELIVKDAATGHYVIDESNSIAIDAFLIDGVLYSQFQVQSSLITASYRRDGEQMIVELVSADPTKPTASGGEGNIPEVKSNRVTSLQTAKLQRLEPRAAKR